MKNIKSIIEAHAESCEVLEEEQKLVTELISSLDNIGDIDIACHFNGIKDAVLLLIGGYDSDESHEEETFATKRIIKPLSLIESATLENYGQEIHIALADEFLLPGANKKLPWPLNHELIRQISISLSENPSRH